MTIKRDEREAVQGLLTRLVDQIEEVAGYFMDDKGRLSFLTGTRDDFEEMKQTLDDETVALESNRLASKTFSRLAQMAGPSYPHDSFVGHDRRNQGRFSVYLHNLSEADAEAILEARKALRAAPAQIPTVDAGTF